MVALWCVRDLVLCCVVILRRRLLRRERRVSDDFISTSKLFSPIILVGLSESPLKKDNTITKVELNFLFLHIMGKGKGDRC